MILILFSMILGLCAFFVMGILILGKRAERRKELLLIDDLYGLQRRSPFAASPQRSGAERPNWGSLRAQQNPLSM